MARCQSCSAPLPANTQHCSYCGVRNDVDLHGKHDFQINGGSARRCPQCGDGLQTITLTLDQPLQIERCASCFGLFFDPGEVERLLDSAVSPVFAVNRELLGNINQDRYPKANTVKYLKCPVCLTLMNRVAFAYRSGVVIDQCKAHGVWLEGGQISHLLEWKKAGGQLWHEKKRAEQQAKPRNTKPIKTEAESWLPGTAMSGDDAALLETIASLVFKVFT